MPFNQAAVKAKTTSSPEHSMPVAGKGRIISENESVSSDVSPAWPWATARLPQPRQVPAGADDMRGHRRV